jgi:carbon-monoxide dehydrogenase large subunit
MSRCYSLPVPFNFDLDYLIYAISAGWAGQYALLIAGVPDRGWEACMTTMFGIGQPVRRSEDRRFLTGRGRYADDINLPGQAYGFVVRSPHAHARIARVDVGAAAAAPGVVAVLTGADFAADGIGSIPPTYLPQDRGASSAAPSRISGQHAIAAERVRHVGEPVAYVVAENLAQARDAAELVAVDYAPLPAVTRIGAARAPAAPLVWDHASSNLAFVAELGDRAAVAAGLAKAQHVTRLSVVNNRLSPNPIEPRAAIASIDSNDERLTLITATQAPHRLRSQLATAFGLPENRLRVIARDVGGGFGMKGSLFPEEVLVLWAAQRTGRAVKWTAERSESLIVDAHGRDMITTGEIGFDSEGRIMALRATVQSNLGAFLTNAGAVPSLLAASFMSNVYAIPAVHVTIEGVYTNTAFTCPYRGAGVPEAAHLVESLIEQAARELAADPLDLRRRNFIGPQAMPYRTPLLHTYDSGEFDTVLEKTLRLADWDGFAARKAESEHNGRLRGRAVAAFINERMEIRFDPSGTVTIIAGTFSHGQGHETVFAQLVSEWLGVPFGSIRLIQGDTDAVSFGRGTFASRSAMLGSACLRLACDDIIARGKKLAGHLLEAAEIDIEFSEGTYRVVGTDRAVGIVEVARRAYAMVGVPREFGIGLEAVGAYDSDPP